MKILLVLADGERRDALERLLGKLIECEIDAFQDCSSATPHVSCTNPIAFALLENDAEDEGAFALKDALDTVHPQATILRVAGADEEDAPSPWADANRINLPASLAAIAEALGLPILEDGAGEPLPSEGTCFGNYRLIRLESSHARGGCFLAIQTSLNRPVSLHLFGPEDRLDPEDWNAFLREAAAQSQVVHPAIPAVYEAGEWQGWLFQASERVEGSSLEALLQNGQKLPPETLLQTALAVSSALRYLHEKGIRHRPLSASQILIPEEGSPRLLNTATDRVEGNLETRNDLPLFGHCLRVLAPEDLPENLDVLLKRTQRDAREPLSSWEEMAKALRSVESELSGFGEPSSGGTETNRQNRAERHARNPLWGRLALAGCAILAGVIAAWTQRLSAWHEEDFPILSAQVKIPAGTFLVADGRTVQMTEFSIDQTEVSNRQYAAFLRWLEKNPAQCRIYDHEEQPAHWSHVPLGWHGSRPPAVSPGRNSDLETLPVSGVAWWDAFAFARWSGRALVTAEEWEAASRGSRGLLYPWGDEPKTEFARSQETADPSGHPGPTAVHSQRDRSPSGVLGMAGNLAEWTESASSKEVRSVKGGNFLAPLESLDAVTSYPCESRLPQLGFRTRSRKD